MSPVVTLRSIGAGILIQAPAWGFFMGFETCIVTLTIGAVFVIAPRGHL